MSRLEAVIFDVDGTLADTERDGHRVAFNAAFADAGLDWQWSETLYGELLAVTGGKERILRFIEQYRPAFSQPEDLNAFIADLHRRKTGHYVRQLSSGGVPLRTGVLRLLREARAAGLRLAIATTTTPDNVTALLEHAGEPGARDWFEVIAAGDAVARKKPAPDIFALTLERMGLAPAACAVVEDSDNGVRAALGAGLNTLLVTVSSYTEGQDFSGAALVVDTLGEPRQPTRVLSGTLPLPRGYLDIDALRELHRRTWSS